MLEHVSLEALVGIANHPTLSTFLSEVIIGLQKLPYDSHFRTEGSRRYREAGYMSRNLLLQTGVAHSMLVEAFSKLPNLKTIGLRDYDGAGRVRDGRFFISSLGSLCSYRRISRQARSLEKLWVVIRATSRLLGDAISAYLSCGYSHARFNVRLPSPCNRMREGETSKSASDPSTAFTTHSCFVRPFYFTPVFNH